MDLLLPAGWAVAGAIIGVLLAVAWRRPQLVEARREAERLGRERAEMAERIAELDETARRAGELAATGIEQPARDAHRVMRGRTDVQLSIARGIEDLERALGVGVGKGATVSAVAFDFEGSARRLEQTSEEQAARMRQISIEAEAAVHAAEGASTAAHALSEILGAFDRGADVVGSAAIETSDAAVQMEGAQRRLGSSANETAEHSTTVAASAERGYRAVHRTLDEIDRIRELADVARRGIEALAVRMAGVGEVVRVIQEIAEKTNLLALNASIIAAQAGEHGRSFAVVAQEIKALAQRTASSTKQIGELIRGAREESEQAMESMTVGVATIAQGFQVALGAGDALGEIRQSARVAHKRVQAMMRAMDEESSAVGRIVEAAHTLADRAAALSGAVKEQSLHRARLAEGSTAFAESSARLGRLAREQLETGGRLIDAVSRLASEAQGTTRGQKELRRHVDRIHSGAALLSGLESEVAERVAAVSDAAAQLRAELARLSS